MRVTEREAPVVVAVYERPPNRTGRTRNWNRPTPVQRGKDGLQCGCSKRTPALNRRLFLFPAVCGGFASGETGTRTRDTMIFSHVLYQLSYLALTENAPRARPERF